MAKLQADKVQTTGLEPTVLNPTSLDNYHDPTILSKEKLRTATNVVFDNGYIEKIQGTHLENSDTPGAAVTGLHRVYGVDGTKATLRIANGTLKSGPAAFATTVLSSLSTSKTTPFIDVNGVAWGVNETNGIIRYNPLTATGVTTGLSSPAFRKKICFFESDETWSGGTASTAVYRPDEMSGGSLTSRYLTAIATTTYMDNTALSMTFVSLDDAGYGGSTDDDYIVLWVFHTIRQNVDYIGIHFSTGDAAFTNYYYSYAYRVNLTVGDYQWTELRFRKGSFVASGSPNWATVRAIRLYLVTVTGSSTVYFDNCYLSAAPIKASIMRKDIANGESTSNETWSDNYGYVFDPSPVYSGYRCIGVWGTAGGAARTATCTLGTALDLTTWWNQATVSTNDEIVFWIRTNNLNSINSTNPLTLNIGQDSSNYYTYTWTTKAALGLNGADNWYEVRIGKSSFSTGAGSPSWATVDWLQFVTSAMTGTTYYMLFDDIRLEQRTQTLSVCDMEADEAWSISGAGEMRTDIWTQGWATEGVQCLSLYGYYPGYLTESYGQLNFSSVKDLTAFSDASASDTSDYITFSLFVQEVAKIKYVEIWLDNNSLTTFANAYWYRVEKDEFPYSGERNWCGTQIKLKKSDFINHGGSGAWSTIGAIKFIVASEGGRDVGGVFIDNVVMRRKAGLTGRYYYKYVFKKGDIYSPVSPVSDMVEAYGGSISLTNIHTSLQNGITSREIYRLGGSNTETWRLLKIIGDNVTTTLIDDVDDDDLGIPISAEVPEGNLTVISANNLAYDNEADRIYYWGHPSYRNRVYYSNPAYYYSVNEGNYREFPKEVMGVVPYFGQIFIFYRDDICKISGDIPTGDYIELGVGVGACSYWATTRMPINGIIPFASWDNVYEFDGYRSNPIGDEVKGYFLDRESYLSTVYLGYHKDTLYIACKEKTGTPTTNGVVLRYYRPTKSWSTAGWNASVFTTFAGYGDANDFWYGSSTDGNVYSINYATYQFGGSAITSTAQSPWFNNPDGELSLTQVEFKAKGTNAGSLTLNLYTDLSDTPKKYGSVSLTTTWQTFSTTTLAVKDSIRSDFISVGFSHATDSAYFYLKDIVLHFEVLPKRMDHNTITLA